LLEIVRRIGRQNWFEASFFSDTLSIAVPKEYVGFTKDKADPTENKVTTIADRNLVIETFAIQVQTNNFDDPSVNEFIISIGTSVKTMIIALDGGDGTGLFTSVGANQPVNKNQKMACEFQSDSVGTCVFRGGICAVGFYS